MCAAHRVVHPRAEPRAGGQGRREPVSWRTRGCPPSRLIAAVGRTPAVSAFLDVGGVAMPTSGTRGRPGARNGGYSPEDDGISKRLRWFGYPSGTRARAAKQGDAVETRARTGRTPSPVAAGHHGVHLHPQQRRDGGGVAMALECQRVMAVDGGLPPPARSRRRHPRHPHRLAAQRTGHRRGRRRRWSGGNSRVGSPRAGTARRRRGPVLPSACPEETQQGRSYC